jgi:voltage-gated potassium channel Kch
LIKTTIIVLTCLAFGLSLQTASQAGLILSQGGEFAFVAFGLARNLGILTPATTKLMLTSVALTMAVTPMLADVGTKVAKKLEEKSDFSHYLSQSREANEIKESDDFVVVVGYGIVGKVVCDLLDRKFVKYVGLEIDPNKAIQARNKGLPVFYGDIGRPEVAEAFNVEKAKAVIVAISDKDQANRAVISLRRQYPDKKIFCRAKDADHAERLQRTLDVIAMVPIVPEDNLLLTLPFGGAVLQSLGIPSEEVSVIMEEKRKELFNTRNLSNEESQMILFQLGIKDEEVEKQDFDKNSGQTSVAATDDAKPSMVKEVIEVMKKQQSLQTPELKAENSPEESEVK